jgi:hypothetical protein
MGVSQTVMGRALGSVFSQCLGVASFAKAQVGHRLGQRVRAGEHESLSQPIPLSNGLNQQRIERPHRAIFRQVPCKQWNAGSRLAVLK